MTAGLVHFQLLGRFRVSGASGEDLTPNSKRGRALLAILCLSAEYSRSRNSIQDKLWSTRSDEQGKGSLRTELSAIRKAFGNYNEVLETDRESIWLKGDLVTTDVAEDALAARLARKESHWPELLDGFDIRDDEFDDWLREQRTRVTDLVETLRSSTSSFAGSETSSFPSMERLSGQVVKGLAEGLVVPWLRLDLPEQSNGCIANVVARGTANQIAGALHERCLVARTEHHRSGPGLSLSVNGATLQDAVLLNASLTLAPQGIVIWSETAKFDIARIAEQTETGLKGMVNRAVDSGSWYLRHAIKNPEAGGSFVLCFDAVTHMFSASRDRIESAKTNLLQAHSEHPNGLFLAWRAYLNTFLVGENFNADRQSLIEEAEELCALAFEASPGNSMVLALASHAQCFLLKNYGAGRELAERAISMDQSNPLAFAYAARAFLYTGQTREGYDLASKASAIAGIAPYRYTIDFIHGVAALLTGRLAEAESKFDAVRATAPSYRPPIRYLIGLSMHRGDREKARRLIKRMKLLEPDFDIAQLREMSYPADALRSAGISELQLGDL